VRRVECAAKKGDALFLIDLVHKLFKLFVQLILIR
jgi:hypothetical protein